jgi:hypothetical protein
MLVIKSYIIDSDKIHAQIRNEKKKNKVSSNVNFWIWNKLKLKKQKDQKK